MTHKRYTRYTMQDARTMQPVCTRNIFGYEFTHYVATLCDDGIVRRADMGDADTFSTRPAKVTIKGQPVYGFVTRNTTADTEDGYFWEFVTLKDQHNAKNRYRLSIVD